MIVAESPVRQPAFATAVGLFFQTVRKHAVACLVLALPYAAFVGLSEGLSKAVTLDVGPSAVAVSEVAVTGIVIFAALALFVVLNVVLYPLTLGRLAMIGSAEVYGDAIDVEGIRRQVVDRAVDAIGAFLLTTLILAVAPVAVGLLAVIVATVGGPLAGFALLIFAVAAVVVPEVYVAVRLSVAVPVVIREGLKPKAALRRSWDLVHGTRWAWVFGVYLASALVAVVAVVLLGVLAGLVHTSGIFKFAVDTLLGAFQAAAIAIATGVATGVVYGSVASEVAHAPAELVAHEVLPGELPPPPAF